MKYIFFGIIIWYFILWPIIKYLGKSYIKTKIKESQSQFNSHYQNKQATYQKEGEIKVEVNNSQNKKNRKNSDNFEGGEYVDYEEVK
ncbi:MAG: DUF4834 family protein [Pseudarcicella sp.]|nr:DUF4834 family protein [Pseudarcicella sp.]